MHAPHTRSGPYKQTSAGTIPVCRKSGAVRLERFVFARPLRVFSFKASERATCFGGDLTTPGAERRRARWMEACVPSPPAVAETDPARRDQPGVVSAWFYATRWRTGSRNSAVWSQWHEGAVLEGFGRLIHHSSIML
jgi:hypothetical protein